MRALLRKVSDQSIENFIGNLLRYGVILAAMVVLVGGVAFLAKYGRAHPDFSHFASEPSRLRHVDTIFLDAFSFSARGLIQLGLLLLIATPVARVLFSVFAFAFQRDRLYVVVTLIVLAVLIVSLSGA
ncbi:DUF1634 domain-containing protein [candidate division GN15 bacterium]|uniref:DUF1634 domain-containing protein n=1 Tax=candidate division GN15 bacterium TaxID=2072418 RepID=A0A855X7T3_9BACT|nr:MAG: DUF1634 domain-containing protein [candidate division GN15 bacterium]